MTELWQDVDYYTRLKHIGRVVTRTPKVRSGLAALKSTLRRHQTRPEGTGLLFTGDTRAGKTTIVKEFLYDCVASEGLKLVKTFDPAGTEAPGQTAVTYVQRREPGKNLERPVLVIQVGNKVSYRSLLKHTISAISETKCPPIDNPGDYVHLLAKQIIGQKIRLVIFDDVNNIAEHKGENSLHSAAEVFKILMKDGRVQVALVGMESSWALLRSNKQLDEMIHRRHSLTPYAMPGSSEKPTEFCDFVSDLKAQMPFDLPCPIDDPACLVRLHIKTEGRPGAVSLLLTDAVEYALDNNLPYVDQSVFGEVLKEFRGVPDNENVFLAADQELPLHRQRARANAIKPPKTGA